MKEFVERSMTYERYIELVDEVLARGETTGPVQSPEKTEFTRLNRRRMERLGKTVRPDEAAADAARTVRRPMIWLTITEAWCGDAAQNIPVIEKFAAESGNIETRYILRDENPELMDMFLSEGARAIPKLVALDARDLSVLGTWGSRPAAATEYFRDMKANGLEKPAISENLQRWYNADRGRSLFSELAGLASAWDTPRALSAAAQRIRPGVPAESIT